MEKFKLQLWHSHYQEIHIFANSAKYKICVNVASKIFVNILEYN